MAEPGRALLPRPDSGGRRDGSFASVRQIVSAIEAYFAERNLAPKRYLWHAKGEDVLAKILRPVPPSSGIRAYGHL